MRTFAIQIQQEKRIVYSESSGIDGIVYHYFFSSFAGGALKTEFNESYLSVLRNDFKGAQAKKKGAGFGVIFGKHATNLPGIRYVTLVEKAHQGISKPGQPPRVPVPMSVPVPYDTEFTDKVIRFIKWLSEGLKKDSKAYDNLEYVTIAFANQEYLELRLPDQDFTDPEKEPFNAAAEKWKAVGFTPDKMIIATEIICNAFKLYFPDKQLILPIISGLAGFPCIDKNGNICTPNQRPNLTEQIVSNFTGGKILPAWYAIDDKNSPPEYFNNEDCLLQSENFVPDNFEQMIAIKENALKHNAEFFEIHASQFKKYPQYK